MTNTAVSVEDLFCGKVGEMRMSEERIESTNFEYTYFTERPSYPADLFDCCGATLTAIIRMKKGAIDHLFQRPTMAAYRYVRSMKRKKEKERRKALKAK